MALGGSGPLMGGGSCLGDGGGSGEADEDTGPMIGDGSAGQAVTEPLKGKNRIKRKKKYVRGPYNKRKRIDPRSWMASQSAVSVPPVTVEPAIGGVKRKREDVPCLPSEPCIPGKQCSFHHYVGNRNLNYEKIMGDFLNSHFEQCRNTEDFPLAEYFKIKHPRCELGHCVGMQPNKPKGNAAGPSQPPPDK